MAWTLAFLRRIGRAALGHVLFFAVAIGWTGLLYAVYPWTTTVTSQWPGHSPIAVSSGGRTNSRIILYRELSMEMQKDPELVPWPATPTGTASAGQIHTHWKTDRGKPWQLEVSWDDKDHVLESRYRLQGQHPVLVATRVRDVSIAFKGMLLAILTLLFWKAAQWWRQRAGKD